MHIVSVQRTSHDGSAKSTSPKRSPIAIQGHLFHLYKRVIVVIVELFLLLIMLFMLTMNYSCMEFCNAVPCSTLINKDIMKRKTVD